MGAGPLALYTLTATAPLVTADLGIGGARLGVLPATAFALAALVSPVAGRYADRLSGRVVLAVLFAGAGLALLGVAAAPSYGWLLAAVALSGATQALSNPVTNQLIAAHVSQGQRGGLMGVKQSGVQMSQFGAGLLLPSLALWWGWRGAALAAAVVAAVGLVMVRSAVPATPPAPGRDPGRRPADLPVAVWWLTGYALVSGAALQATNVYLPLYGFERLEMPVRAAGLTAAVAGGVGLVARIAWGRSADRVRNPYPLLSALAAVSALAVGGLLMAETMHAPALLWAGAALFGASGIAANVVIMLALVRTTPLRVVGSASGVLAVGLYLGFALGPVCFGLLADAAGSYRPAWFGVAAANVLAAGVAFAGRRVRREDRSSR
ncbi:MFS transporter [Streptomyces tuirus]